jgi:hypothetical protein
MPLRRRGPLWHYRFTIAGQEFGGSTDLRATEENRKAAERFEKHQRQLVLSGRAFERTKDFATAAGEFISCARTSNTAKSRILLRGLKPASLPSSSFSARPRCRTLGQESSNVTRHTEFK